MNRRVLVNLGVFAVIFGVLVWWSARNVVTIEALERPYTISAEFEQAAGILPRAEVAYLGVNYGSVDSVERRDGHVVVRMKIDRGKRIPSGATAHIFRKSAIGEPFVDFFPPERGAAAAPVAAADAIEPGEVVPLARTTVPIEFAELLRSASELVRGIDPARTQVLVHELATGLHGRAESLRELITSGEVLARTFAERTDVLDRLMANNARLTAVVAEHRGSLGQPLSDLRALAASLRESGGDVATLLDHGAAFLARTADLVESRKATLDCALQGLELVVREAGGPARLDALRALLQDGPVAFDGVWDARDVEADGVWVRVGIVVNPDDPPAQYVPPRPLPEARGPVACSSRFSDAAGTGPPDAASPGASGPVAPGVSAARPAPATREALPVRHTGDAGEGRLLLLLGAVAAAGAGGMWHSARSTRA